MKYSKDELVAMKCKALKELYDFLKDGPKTMNVRDFCREHHLGSQFGTTLIKMGIIIRYFENKTQLYMWSPAVKGTNRNLCEQITQKITEYHANTLSRKAQKRKVMENKRLRAERKKAEIKKEEPIPTEAKQTALRFEELLPDNMLKDVQEVVDRSINRVFNIKTLLKTYNIKPDSTDDMLAVIPFPALLDFHSIFSEAFSGGTLVIISNNGITFSMKELFDYYKIKPEWIFDL